MGFGISVAPRTCWEHDFFETGSDRHRRLARHRWRRRAPPRLRRFAVVVNYSRAARRGRGRGRGGRSRAPSPSRPTSPTSRPSRASSTRPRRPSAAGRRGRQRRGAQWTWRRSRTSTWRSSTRLMHFNVRGTFVIGQQAVRRLRDGGALGELLELRDRPGLPTYSAYVASKGDVEALTLVLARELRGRDVTVNTVTPADGREPLPRQRLQQATTALQAAAARAPGPARRHRRRRRPPRRAGTGTR